MLCLCCIHDKGVWQPCLLHEVALGCGRYHLSLFYTEKEIGMAYSWITAGTALSQVLLQPWRHCCDWACMPQAPRTDSS